jgi:Cys-tRNA(Pro)/Cys-tRNA(Cys) deacylase
MAAGTRAIELLRASGVPFAVREYSAEERHGRDRDRRPSYGAEAAEALGVAQDRIYKTLVASADGRLVLAVVPVAADLDLKRLADAVGARRAELAPPVEAERATGSVIGGISPLAPRRSLPVIVDATALGYQTVLVSAGRRGLQLELAPRDLVRVAGARVEPIGRSR